MPQTSERMLRRTFVASTVRRLWDECFTNERRLKRYCETNVHVVHKLRKALHRAFLLSRTLDLDGFGPIKDEQTAPFALLAKFKGRAGVDHDIDLLIAFEKALDAANHTLKRQLRPH